MIAITGAAGKTGRAVIAALAARGADVRALVRRPEQTESVQAAGAAEIVAGDLRDSDAPARLARGCTALYHICPNVHPDELAIGRGLIGALAALPAPPRLVYHSVLRPQIEAMPHHWAKLRVEEAIFAAALPCTILQPAPYMQNILAQRASIVRDGLYRTPYARHAATALVDLGDVAEAAARVLTEPGHEGAVYELVGVARMDQGEIAAVLSAALGRPIAHAVEDRGEWAQAARARGLGETAVATLLAMFEYYEAHGLPGNPTVLRWLLGRAPRSLAEWAQERRDQEGSKGTEGTTAVDPSVPFDPS